ncbi:MAG: amino acid permease [Sphingomonadales bacterium]|nr:MAG: amino acid permease [Sphingomonadales bacterium]
MSAPDAAKVGLERGLGLPAAFSLVAGGIIGVSIFLIPGAVAHSAGTANLALLVWIVAGLLSACAALCFAELGTSIPETGGLYVYLRRAYRSEALAFCYAWMICFAYGSGAIAVVAIMAATYLVPLFAPAGADSYLTPITACGLILSTLFLNITGVRNSGKVQVFLTALKLAMLAGLIAVPFLFLDFDMSWASGPVRPSPDWLSTASGFVDGLLLCIFSFSGAFFVTQVAGEIRHPERNVSRAIILGFAAVFILYIGVNISYFSALPFEKLTASDRVAGDIMGMAFGKAGTIAMSLGIGLSALAVVNAQMTAYPRVAFALGQSGFLKKYLARVEEGSHVPAVAITLVGGWSAVLSLTGSYQAILATMAFVSQIFSILVVLAVIVLRRREPDLPRPFQTPGYPFTPLVFVVVSLTYMGVLLYQRPAQVALGIAIVAVGLPVFAISRWLSRSRDPGSSL